MPLIHSISIICHNWTLIAYKKAQGSRSSRLLVKGIRKSTNNLLVIRRKVAPVPQKWKVIHRAYIIHACSLHTRELVKQTWNRSFAMQSRSSTGITSLGLESTCPFCSIQAAQTAWLRSQAEPFFCWIGLWVQGSYLPACLSRTMEPKSHFKSLAGATIQIPVTGKGCHTGRTNLCPRGGEWDHVKWRDNFT